MKIPSVPLKDLDVKQNNTIEEIFEQMSKSGGFEARNMADSLNILVKMINDKKCLRFVSFVGSVVSTGLRGILKDMIKRKMFDVVITTCGALDHDIAKSYADYLQGSFSLDDKDLAKNEFHRLGNVIIPLKNYGPLIEEKVQAILKKYYDQGTKEMSGNQLCSLLGNNLGKDSFLYWASKNSIPVIVPGIMDGAVGSQLWLFSQKNRDFKMNLLSDSELLSEYIFKAKKSGAMMIGGGISKHHTMWWNQYRGGLDYAVYVTTAQEYDGSLSGAQVREAISWGKVSQSAKQVTLHAEVTTALPFLYNALLRRLDIRNGE